MSCLWAQSYKIPEHIRILQTFCFQVNLWVQTEGNVILLAIPIYCARDYEWQHWTVLNGFSWVVGLWPQNWIWILFALFCILSIDSIFLISIFNHSFVGSSLTLIFFFTLGFPLSPYNLFLIFFTKYIHKHFWKFWIRDKDWSLHVYAVGNFYFFFVSIIYLAYINITIPQNKRKTKINYNIHTNTHASRNKQKRKSQLH